MYNPRSQEELVHAEFSATNPSSTYPLNTSVLHNFFAQYAPSIWSGNIHAEGPTWDVIMQHCYVQVSEYAANGYTETKKFPPKKFADVADFMTYINNTISNDGVTFTAEARIKIFSKVDGDVPSVSKISAFNHYYHSLCNGEWFGDNESLEIDQNRFPDTEAFVIGAWQAVWGETIDPAVYQADPEKWNGTIWFQRHKKKNMYNLPAIGVNAVVECRNGTTKRYARLEDDGSLVNMSWPTYEGARFEFMNAAVSDIRQINGFTTFHETSRPRTDIQNPDWSTGGRSFVIMFGIKRGNMKAIYVKPIGGIDTFMVPKYDENKYRLEALYSAKQHRDRVRVVEVAPGEGSQTYSRRILRLQLFMGGKSRSIMRNTKNYDSAWNVRFYLRDLTTGNVSRLSDHCIKAVKNPGWSPLTFLVERY